MELKNWVFQKGSEDIGETVFPHNNTITTPSGLAGAFTKEECAKMLELSMLANEREAKTSDGLGEPTSSHRISKVRDIFPSDDTDWVFTRLEAIMLEINKQYQFDIRGFFEGAQIYQYPTGGFLDWHSDVAKGLMSTRKLSMTIQLSDESEYEGGGLEFFDYKGHTAPKGIGALTVFPSYMMHQVAKVTKGQRYSWVSWIHGPPLK